MRALAVDTRVIDERAAAFGARGGQPGLAYGVVAGGELVHAGGVGASFPGGPMPGADTVFRIASMTKSFTASLVLLLRDEGKLALDDQAQDYVPELRALTLPADSRPVTIRQLLTMTAGFPTDDPWGDRQQGLPHEDFARLLADGGVRPARPPGTRFEYSNLGYAILGRVISAVTGTGYEEAARERLLRPLAMTRTGFEAAEFAAADLARGFQRNGADWLELPFERSGAFAPMGGLFSCVRDLARWVAGFAGDGEARRAAAAGNPLAWPSRREMQLAQVIVPAGVGGPAVHLVGPLARGYGFGLFAEEDPAFGLIVHHSGGYPGYGSHMRWHPATGIGTIVLANGTYARAGELAGDLLAMLLHAQPTSPSAAMPSGGPWPETLAAKETVDELLIRWDDDRAARLFTPNVVLDRPLSQRRADAGALRERIGEFRPAGDRPVESDSPAHCRWWLTGERGTACVQIRLAPLRQPLVQQLTLAIPPAQGSALDEAVRSLAAAAGDAAPAWPAGLPSAASADEILRQLRIARAWSGPCQVSGFLAGDGSASVTVELTGPTGQASLAVDVDRETGTLHRAEVSLLRSARHRRA